MARTFPDLIAAIRTRGGSKGSVSLELLGTLPVIAISVLAALQLAVAGYVQWAAGTAARAGARAVLIGRPPEDAARRALPGILADRSKVSSGNGVKVSVKLPGLVPGLPDSWIEGSSDLGE